MFLQDKLLGISDLKLIENDKDPISEENDKLVFDGVEVDASLFQDDLDELPDSDED
jgi:hypothetical protein